jgi:hypothetical protein
MKKSLGILALLGLIAAGLLSAFSSPSEAADARWSDERLKSSIVQVGTNPLGLGLYEYTIFGKRELGVMAQEVEKARPEAVITTQSGYKMVRYDLLPGWNKVTSTVPSSRMQVAWFRGRCC